MPNKFYNKQCGQMPDVEGWGTGGINTYRYSAKNGQGAGNLTGSPKDKRGNSGARNGADKTGRGGKTFSKKFK